MTTVTELMDYADVLARFEHQDVLRLLDRFRR